MATESSNSDYSMSEIMYSSQASSAMLDSPDAAHTQEESGSRSFVDAVWDKFNDDMAVNDCINIYVPKKGPARLTDSGHLILPRQVHLTACGITEAGHPAGMTRMCQGVTELDLTQNCIASWQEIFQVICCMPRLTFLNLTSNPISSPIVGSPKMVGMMHASISSTASSVDELTASALFSRALAESPNTASTNLSDTDPDISIKGPTTSNIVEVVPLFDASSSKVASEQETAIVQSVETNISPSDQAHSSETTEPTLLVDPTTKDLSEDKTISAATQDGGTDADRASCSPPEVYDKKTGSFSCSPTELPTSLCFLNLRQLVLNDTQVDWQSIVQLLKIFPNLEELHLSLNHYTSVDLLPDLLYPSLVRLFFNGNKVCAWSEINKLGRAFPSLQQLFLAETELRTLDETDCMAESFPCLSLLSLNKTQLEGWDILERLRLLPSLIDVRLQGIPFLEALEEKERRHLLVARLPNVTRLNGSPVTDEEREDAERAFIRLFMDSKEKPARYYELEKIYGKLDPLAKVNLKPQRVFKVKVVINERCEELDVDANQSVRELKKTLQNLVGLPASRFSVFYVDKQIDMGAERLRFPDKKLYTYNLTDGDEFIVEPKT